VAGGLAGGTDATNSDTTVALLRYNTDGSLDTSWSNDGKVRNDVTSGFDYAGSLAIQSDGKIVAGGGANQQKFAALRYNTNGSLDLSFSSDGKVRTDLTSGNDAGGGVAVQTDGRIVVGGAANLSPNTLFGVVRYNADGSLDSTFGGDGKVTTSFGTSSAGINGVAIQADGKIVTAGFADTGFGLARYLAV
ncbi:MAG TPA: hypothetical protein VKA30_06895, partial [Actinomycetota bacterium]|nr:hypothetical protein [Actinomycetota bacterium]